MLLFDHGIRRLIWEQSSSSLKWAMKRIGSEKLLTFTIYFLFEINFLSHSAQQKVPTLKAQNSPKNVSNKRNILLYFAYSENKAQNCSASLRAQITVGIHWAEDLPETTSCPKQNTSVKRKPVQYTTIRQKNNNSKQTVSKHPIKKI